MGQAKRRGTYEERKALAMGKRIGREIVDRELSRKRAKSKVPSYTMAQLLALLSSPPRDRFGTPGVIVARGKKK